MTSWPGSTFFPAGHCLETERLRLRIMEERDLDALAAMYGDAETMRYIGEGKVLSRMESWRSIAAALGHWLLKGYGMWAVELKATGTVVGRVGYIDAEGWPGFELGWLIAREHWGRGYASEAALAARDYATGTLKKDRVISLIRIGNERSVRVAEKLGFVRDGTVEMLGAPALVYANRKST
jgi:RimJ/RimL family protein N-acetyltransferase